jgi:hypothetical protein
VVSAADPLTVVNLSFLDRIPAIIFIYLYTHVDSPLHCAAYPSSIYLLCLLFLTL